MELKRFVESVYHSSKVYNGIIQFNECKDMIPKESKKFISEKINEGKLILSGFRFNNMNLDLNTKSLCYDYIYILGLVQNEELSEKNLNYDCFTDIVFNKSKGISCQAITCAIYKYLENHNIVEEFIKNPYNFEYLYINMYKY